MKLSMPGGNAFCVARLGFARACNQLSISVLRLSVLLLIGGVFAEPVYAGALRTQSFALEKGWNAIYLDVEPVVNYPSVIFKDTPVDVVSSYDGSSFTQQFSSSPGTDLMKLLGWATWYAPDRDDSFLSDLSAVYGHKPYLVHATEATQIEIEGESRLTAVSWRADSFNLVGFSFSALAAPTFAQFFEGSSAHKDAPVYRMVNGVWKKIIDPANTVMKSGEAFWIFCDGSSSFQGPLEVTVGTGGSVFLKAGESASIIVKNRSSFPLAPVIAYQVDDETVFPVSIAVDVIGSTWEGIHSVAADLGEGSWSVDLPALDSDKGFTVPFVAVSGKIDESEVNSLLCIRSDLGTEVWVPVRGLREDLQ